MENEQKFSGWKLLFSLGIVYLFVMGFAQYGGSVTAPHVLRDIPMSRAKFGLGFTLLNLFIGINSAFVGAPLVKRFGIRSTAIFGCLMLVVIALLMQVVNQPWQYIFVFGVLTSITLAVGTIVPYSTWVARWFKRYRGRAMGYIMVIASFGGTLSSPVLGRILASTGGNWRTAWLFIGAIGFIAAIANWFLIKESPESVGQVPDGIVEIANDAVNTKLVTSHQWDAKDAYKTLAFWMIFAGALAFFLPFFFFVSHYILHISTAGVSGEAASWAMGIMTLGGVAGRLLSGFLSEKVEARYVLATGIIPSILGIFIAVNVSTTPMALLAAALFGMGFGWPYTAMLTTLANFYGIKAYPQVMGTMMLLTAIVASPTALISGMIFDAHGSYTLAFTIIGAVCIVGFFAALLAKMPQPSMKNTKNLEEIRS